MRIYLTGFIASLTLILLTKDFFWIVLSVLAALSLVIIIPFKRPVLGMMILCAILFGSISVIQMKNEMKDVPSKGFISKEMTVTDFAQSRPDGLCDMHCGQIKLISSNLTVYSPGDRILARGYTRTTDFSGRSFTQLYVTESVLLRKGPVLFDWINKFRLFVEQRINLVVNKDTRTLLYCMILANENYIDYSASQSFRLSGVTHLLAISGLNVALISIVLAFIFGRFLRGWQASLLTTVIIILYCAVAGFGPSIVRAGLMFIIYNGVKLTGFKMDFADSVLAAAFLSLLYQPSFVFQGGFWLSYMAVLGIYYFTEPIKEKLSFTGKFFSESLAVTFSATVMTLPLLLFYFKGFSIVAPVANLLIIQPFNALTCVLFGDFILNIAGLGFLNFLIDPVIWLLWNFSKMVADYLSRLPFAFLSIPDFPVVLLIACFAIIIAVLFLLPKVLFYWRLKKLRLIVILPRPPLPEGTKGLEDVTH